MQTLEQIIDTVALSANGGFYEVHPLETGIELNDTCFAVEISASSEWTFSELDEISLLLHTDEINVVGHGCESCGYGSTIRVYNIKSWYKVVDR